MTERRKTARPRKTAARKISARKGGGSHAAKGKWVYAFGGGFHCCTVDIRREGSLRSYFPTLDEQQPG